MGKKLTIIGSGATALAAAATFTALGHQVTLTDIPERAENLEAVRKRGGILLRGNGVRGHYTPAEITLDVAAAAAAADIIIVSAVAGRHREFARLIAPAARDGQVIVIVPGNVGALVFADVFQKAGVTADVPLLDVQGNLFPCRITGPAEVNSGAGLRKKRAAAFPAKNTADAIARLEGVLELEPAKNVFETALNAPNVINHLTSTVLNAAAIDHADGSFSLFLQGLTPSVLKGLDVAYREWRTVTDRLGYWQMENPTDHLRQVADTSSHPELNVFRSLDGPGTLKHRYVTEDAPCGVALLVSLARKAGVEIPFTQGVLSIISALNGTDYYAEGRTLENLGLAELSLEEIERYLETGIR